METDFIFWRNYYDNSQQQYNVYQNGLQIGGTFNNMLGTWARVDPLRPATSNSFYVEQVSNAGDFSNIVSCASELIAYPSQFDWFIDCFVSN